MKAVLEHVQRPRGAPHPTAGGFKNFIKQKKRRYGEGCRDERVHGACRTIW